MKNFFTCEEVASRYGVKPGTVWSWIRDKKLPAVRIGKQYRITPRDLERFELSGRTVPLPAINNNTSPVP